MVVAVPCLAKGDEGGGGQVVALHAGAVDHPVLRPGAMGDVTDQPMAGDARRDPDGHAPDQPRQPADRPEQQRPGKLLRHPAGLQPAQEAVVAEIGFGDEAGWMVEVEPAVHLPPRILQHRRTMGMERVAIRLALRPVAHVVQPDHAERAGHADQRAEIHEQPFEPARRDEAAMDQQPVQPDRMAGA
ncbi:hypothetical protein ACVOMT_07010 [Sphingomonas panni]